MSSFSTLAPATRTIAFDLPAALDAYEASCALLVSRWQDMELYAQAATAMDAIRRHGTSVPPLTVLTLQLMIAHCELQTSLWHALNAGPGAARLQEVLARHALAVEDLRVAAAYDAA